MKIKKLISALCFTAALSVMLTGCFPTGKKPVNSQDNSLPSQNDSMTSQNNNSADNSGDASSGMSEVKNLSVNVNFADNYPVEAPVVTVKLRIWDKETVKSAMLNGRTVVEEKGNDMDPNYRFLALDDGSNITYGSSIDGAFLWHTAIGIKAQCQSNVLRQYVGSAKKEIYDLGLIYESGELTNFASADAKERVDRMISDLGITNAGEPKIYSVPADVINEQNKDETYLDEKEGEEIPLPKVTEDDEVYVLKYPIMYGDIAMPLHRTLGKGISSLGSYIDVVVSKDEIVYFRYQSPFDEEYETGETVKFNADAKAALDILVDNFSKQLLTSQTEIFSCDLIYVSFKTINDTSAEMHPMWCFGIANRDNDGTLQKVDYKYVDPSLCTVVSNFG